MREWSIRRSRLNHELVSNRLLQRLTALKRLAAGLVESKEDPTIGLKDMWDRIRTEAMDLESTFLDAMSPKCLFNDTPLCHCSDQTKSWLKPYIHEKWLKDTGAKERKARLAETIRKADEAMVQLHDRLTHTKDFSKVNQHIIQAYKEVNQLSNALTAMPHSVFFQ